MIRRRTLLGAALTIGYLSRHAIAEENYLDVAVMLDAEELAEAGIKDAYVDLLPKLREFVAQPNANAIDEELGSGSEFYKVRSAGKTYVIYNETSNDLFEGWARATAAFFEIVNAQLTATKVRFFALYGGNDLQGVFLTMQDADMVRSGEARRENWPYQPTMQAPWYGQYHDEGASKPWYQTVPQ